MPTFVFVSLKSYEMTVMSAALSFEDAFQRAPDSQCCPICKDFDVLVLTSFVPVSAIGCSEKLGLLQHFQLSQEAQVSSSHFAGQAAEEQNTEVA